MTLNHALLLHSFAPPHTQASPSTLHFPSRSHQLSSRSLPSYPLLDRHAPPYPALHISFSLSNQSCFSPLHTSTPPLLPSAILHIRPLSHSSPHPSPRPPSFLTSTLSSPPLSPRDPLFCSLPSPLRSPSCSIALLYLVFAQLRCALYLSFLRFLFARPSAAHWTFTLRNLGRLFDPPTLDLKVGCWSSNGPSMPSKKQRGVKEADLSQHSLRSLPVRRSLR